MAKCKRLERYLNSAEMQRKIARIAAQAAALGVPVELAAEMVAKEDGERNS